MSFVLAAPEALVSAASDLAGIGSTISTANAAAAPPTTGLVAAAADEVSAQVAALFSEHALGYQQLSAQVSEFHQRFVTALTAGANAYASVEANAVRTLTNAVHAPAEMLLGHPLIGNGGAQVGSFVANAVHQLEGAVLGTGATGLLGGGASGLLGGTGAATTRAAAALLAPAANALAPIGTAIENAYLAIEPWVRYGFELAEWAVRYLPWIGWFAPQILYFYDLFEPIVQSVLFNTIDFLDGTVSFSQGLNNISMATTASINQFITTEIYWIRSFFPPFPPIGVNLP